MKKVAETPFNGFDESGSRLLIYAFEEENEYQKFEDYSHDELCEYFNVFDRSGYMVQPGAQYNSYSFHVDNLFLIMTETIAYNV